MHTSTVFCKPPRNPFLLCICTCMCMCMHIRMCMRMCICMCMGMGMGIGMGVNICESLIISRCSCQGDGAPPVAGGKPQSIL